MTEFLADGQPGLKEGFLETLVSIHFPAGKIVRVSFTGSGPGSGFAGPKITFPFGQFQEPVQNLSITATGVSPKVVDPPSSEMLKNLMAWSTFSDQGNFVWYNTSFVNKKYHTYSPVIINSPAFRGVPKFNSKHFFTWFFRFTSTPPSGPLDPALIANNEGAVLATFDPTAEENFTVGEILNLINAYADGTQSPGVNGAPALPIGDGGDGNKTAALVAALAGGSHIVPSLGGPNTYVGTEIDSNDIQFNSGWGLIANMYKIDKGAISKPIATISDFKFALDVAAVNITIKANATKGTLQESKS